MNPDCERFFADHPFINVNLENLRGELIKLIENAEYRRRKGLQGRDYVIRRHSLESVMAELYSHYSAAGIKLS
jgi:hypothetical protein